MFVMSEARCLKDSLKSTILGTICYHKALARDHKPESLG